MPVCAKTRDRAGLGWEAGEELCCARRGMAAMGTLGSSSPDHQAHEHPQRQNWLIFVVIWIWREQGRRENPGLLRGLRLWLAGADSSDCKHSLVLRKKEM